MKKKILIKFFSVFVILALVKSSVVLAKQEPKKDEKAQEKKLSPKEEKEKDIRKIKEVFNKLKSLEEQMQKKLNNMFKDFKKEDYEVKNYDLEVFKKNNAPILVYTHKKTGAQVFFNLILDKEKIGYTKDKLIFKVATKNERGLTHFSEHCIAGPFIKEFEKKFKIPAGDLNANTSQESISFVCPAKLFIFKENLEKEYIKKLSEHLKNPVVLKKGDKTFEIEKKRILNEEKDNKGEACENILEKTKIKEIRTFNFGGKISELEKLTLKDFKNFFEKYIHPSNCLLIKNVFRLKPSYIKNYLNMWHEKYFSYFKKREIKNNFFEFKNKEKYLLNSLAKDSRYFKVFNEKTKKNEDFKYKAEISCDIDFLKAKQRLIFFNLTFKFFEKDFNFFVKSLGYSKVFVNGRFVELLGNEKKLFKQKTLEENYKKIMNFIAEKLENLKEDEFLYSRYFDLKFYEKSELNKKDLKNINLWSLPNIYLGSFLSFLVEQSFDDTKKAISDKFFIINSNNELESSYELVDKYIKQSLKSDFNFYKIFSKKGPSYIDVFEKDNKKTLKQMFKKEKEKYKVNERVLPIKLKYEKKDRFVRDFAILLLAEHLNLELNKKQGLIYNSFEPDVCLENGFIVKYSLNKDSVKRLEDFVFKNFDEIMKTVDFKDKDLNELKSRFKERFEFFKSSYENYFKGDENKIKLIKDIKKYIKTGKIDKNSSLKKEGEEELTIGSCFIWFYPVFLVDSAAYADLFTSYDDYKDYKNFIERELVFKEKYLKKFKDKITPEFLKDFLENILKPTLKKIKKSYKLAKEKLNALEKIKLSDVKNLIKTAYLVKDKEEIKNVNKNIINLKKRSEDFYEKIYKD